MYFKLQCTSSYNVLRSIYYLHLRLSFGLCVLLFIARKIRLEHAENETLLRMPFQWTRITATSSLTLRQPARERLQIRTCLAIVASKTRRTLASVSNSTIQTCSIYTWLRHAVIDICQHTRPSVTLRMSYIGRVSSLYNYELWKFLKAGATYTTALRQ